MNKEPTPSADLKPVSEWKQIGQCKCGHPLMEKKCADGEALETRTHHVCPLTGEEVKQIEMSPLPLTSSPQVLDDLLRDIESDLQSALNGRTDKLVFMAKQDIPLLVGHIRSLQAKLEEAESTLKSIRSSPPESAEQSSFPSRP